MLIRKLLAIVSLFFVFTFSSFGELTLDGCKDLLRQSATALQETTQKLEDANEIIKEQEDLIASKEKIIESQEELISTLKSQIPDNDPALLEKIKELEDLLAKAKDALEASNETLERTKQRILDDQKEIERLRGDLQTCIDNTPEIELFTIGGGLVYPYGPQILFMFDIPKIHISIFTDVSVVIEPLGFYFTIGAAYRF